MPICRRKRRIEIWSRAADDRQTLEVSDWQREPVLSPLQWRRRRTALVAPAAAGRGQDYGHWELLLQRARGCYLQLKLIISGNGRATPRIPCLARLAAAFLLSAAIPAGAVSRRP